MNYEEARSFMETDPGVIRPGLDRIRALLAKLGDPEKSLRYIHIAGTNGKGSILAYISTALTLAGCRTGRYLSPTLYTYLERFQIDGRLISEERFTALTDRLKTAVEDIMADGFDRPTQFELETALCFMWFSEEKCGYVVLECGMGGTEDATNVIPAPEAAVFASISMDHMSYLGNTIREIAQSKSGIIKPGADVISSGQSPEAAEVLRKKCEEAGCQFTLTHPEEAELISDTLDGQAFLYRGVKIEVSLPGACQVENAVAAYETLQALRRRGVPLTDELILEGLRNTVWTGRFTVIAKDPLFIVDGAHNPDAARKLVTSIKTYFSGKRLIYLFGIFRDKDYESVIRLTAPLADVICTIATPGNPRAIQADELADIVRSVNPNVTACESVEEGVRRVRALALPEDVIISFGSLSNIGQITRLAGAPDLSELRKDIDRIDTDILALLEKRLAVSEKVAAWKIENGKPVFDGEREKSKLDKLSSLASDPFSAMMTREIFSQIMSFSRKKQYKLMPDTPENSLQFRQIARFPEEARNVVFQGVEGAYSFTAMQSFFGEGIVSSRVDTWREALALVSDGTDDFAVLPIENSTAGGVTDIYDLMIEYPVFIVGEEIPEIRHNLMAVPGAEISGIRRVLSHPQALSQCSKYLDLHPDWERIPALNTAMAAERVAAEGRTDQAAIAGSSAADLYGLQVLADEGLSSETNSTRFVIVSGKEEFLKDAGKVSICIELPHESGSLYRILSHFIYNGLNMTYIYSRPIPDRKWEYRFFIDFEGNLAEPAVQDALRGIRSEAASFRLLGNY